MKKTFLNILASVVIFCFLGFFLFIGLLFASLMGWPPYLLYALYVVGPALLVCIAVNIYKIIKKNKGKENFTLKAFFATVPGFFKSKMFLGMLILAGASFVIETLGFVVTTFLILFLYGLLLGEKKIWRLAIVSVVLALLLHIIFSGLLDVTLPRGTVPFLRNFALWLENLL